MSGNGVNLYDLRLKLFGPTLDDSVLYGIDRMIDCLQRCKNKRAPVRSGSFYWSCETLPVQEPNAAAPLPQPPAPKLSPDEMDLIIDAIVQSRQLNRQKYARKVSTPARRSKPSQPQLRQTRWALVRINEFDDGGKTYEIMKPLDGSNLPMGRVSTDTEIVFALLQNGNTLTYRIQPRQPSEQSVEQSR
uniref:Uncharacterized protein n=1 Tax=Anopheles christyi TaxID=43041 RepID=A0A182JRE9_9DIPT